MYLVLYVMPFAPEFQSWVISPRQKTSYIAYFFSWKWKFELIRECLGYLCTIWKMQYVIHNDVESPRNDNGYILIPGIWCLCQDFVVEDLA